MINAALKKELEHELEHLPANSQQQVLHFARSLSTDRVRGVSGKVLLQYAGSIEADQLSQISEAIKSDCERVDR